MTNLNENHLTQNQNLIKENEAKVLPGKSKPPKDNKTLMTVFSVLGSLLLGIGITILLVALWDRFPLAGRAVISFLPMLIGQGAAIFTQIKKRDNFIWREGASILWMVGVSATVGMFSSLFELHLGAFNCLLIDAALILPIIFFFKATVPLAFYYSAAIAGGLSFAWESSFEHSGIAGLFMIIVYLIPGIVFTLINTKGENHPRFEYCKWISVIAAVAGAICISLCIESFYAIFPICGAFCVCLCALAKKDSWRSPMYLFGVIGGAAISLATTILGLFLNSWEPWFESAEAILTIGICVALFAVGFIKGEKNFENNSTKAIICGAGAVGVVLSVIACFVCKEYEIPVAVGILFFGAAVIQAVALIVKGAQENKFFSLNIGLAMVIVMMFTVLQAYTVDLLVLGLMFIISGCILFGANFAIARSINKQKALCSEKAVDENEEIS